jgi:hypothetical protein
MWDDEGLVMRRQADSGASRPGPGPGRSMPGLARPDRPDALQMPAGDSLERAERMGDGDAMEGIEDGESIDSGAGKEELDPTLGAGASHAPTPMWYRAQARSLIREFLRAVPRSEPDVLLAFVGPDGVPRTITRGQLTTRIDRLRPRQRQIIRLSVEERWSRQRVCEYLSHISYKTLERDQVEALDLLAQMEEA